MSTVPHPLLSPVDPALETAITRIGEDLFARMEAAPVPGIFSKKGAYARVMEWSMQDPAFKTQLFRFVDVLPSLKSSAEIVRHLQEYLGDKAVELNPAMKLGLAASSLAPALIAGPVKANVVAMAAQFVAGETAEDLVRQLRKNARLGLATTIDLLGETVVSEQEADVFLQRNLDVLTTVATALTEDATPAASDMGPGQERLPRLNLSVKISALTPDVHPADPEHSLPALKRRLRPILRRAAEVGAFINFDMESYKLKDLTLALFRSILEEAEFASTRATVGIALQAYLRDSERDLRDLIGWARTHRRPIGVRLVKGAYWDYETLLAQQRDWPVPVWAKKAETDANYERLSTLLLRNSDIVMPAFASHNVRSCAHAIAQADRLGIDPRTYEFQALYGMADELKAALLARGHRVREYCAIGELLPGMAYLVRRLLENTSNEGFLRLKNRGEATRAQLLRNPEELISKAAGGGAEIVAVAGGFRNAPNTDFTVASARERLRVALGAERSKLGQRLGYVVNNISKESRETIPSTDPARPSEVIAHQARCLASEAETALAAARKAQPLWARKEVVERAALFERVADILEDRRHEFNALMILEAGKPWVEADGEVSEAIDFCRYYASEARTLERPTVTQVVAGERCVQRWTPRGTGVVIAPWNFPLAILCGMTVAPVVTGNTVIMKPAEQTPAIAHRLMEVFIAAGLPPGVINLVTGYGEEVGAPLVAHARIDFVAFTGSRAVGLKIWETAGRTPPGQANLKKVVCEMGGKNALIIDADADLDEAIPATLASAFGYAGQKCSALSRLIVLADIHEEFVARLMAAAAAIPVGDPTEVGTVVSPVIEAEAQQKILAAITAGKKEATLAWQATLPEALVKSGGHYVPPTIFTGVKPEGALAREEIFGPVLAVIQVRDLDEAFAVANGTDYALTGGLFSRSPRALERAERELMCGNVYLNRAITGAIVERHPFGGFKMSGGGTKAGGTGYIENFVFPRVVVENVMRRGFAPER